MASQLGMTGEGFHVSLRGQQAKNLFLCVLLKHMDIKRHTFLWYCLVILQDDPALSEYALDGLRQVMAVKSRVVLPFLVPQVSCFKAAV